MSVIIRLQNLPWTASALDIRRFFHGLAIPDGGVHIVGGDRGDAFIAFTTDEDARQAMLNDGGKINNSTIKLFLSSKSEMQNIIAVARTPAKTGSSRSSQEGAHSRERYQQSPHQGQRDPPPQSYPRSGNKHSSGSGGPRSGSPQWDARQPENSRNEQYRKPSPASRFSDSGSYDSRDQSPVSDYGRDGQQSKESYRDARSQDADDSASRRYQKEKVYERSPPPRQSDRSSRYGRNGQSSSHHYQDQPKDYERSRPADDGYSRQSSSNYYPDRYEDKRRGSRSKGREDSPGGYRRDSRDRSPVRERRPASIGIYVYVHNMPETVSYKEVRRFFSGCEIPRDGLKLINDRDGKRNGTGYIKFISEAACEEAYQLNGQFMGNKPVKIDKCSAEEFNMALDSFVPRNDAGSPRYSRDGNDYHSKRPRSYSLSPPPRPRKRSYSQNYPPDVHEGFCVIIENLPVKVEREEIRNFFHGLRVPKGGVYIEYDRDGRTMGSAYVEFFTEREREEALRQHKSILNGKALEIYSISKEEMIQKMNRHRATQKSLPKLRERKEESPTRYDAHYDQPKEYRPPPARGHGRGFHHQGPTRPHFQQQKSEDRKYYCVRLKGLHYDVTEMDIKKFFRGLAVSPGGIHIMKKVNGQCCGIGFVQFVTSTDCEEACSLSMEYMGKRYIQVHPITKKDMYTEMNEGPQETGPPPHQGRGSAVFKGIPNVGEHACVVGCRNVPYRATIREILEFFQDFNPDEESVRLHYDDSGKPTGDAVIAFHNPDDAKRAVQELNQCLMHGRNITLSLL